MKSISHWASHHIFASRALIVWSHMALWGLSISFGILIFLTDIKFNPLMLILIGHLFLLSAFIYPKKIKKDGKYKYPFKTQKVLDGMLLLTGYLVIVFVSATTSRNLTSLTSNESKLHASFIVHRDQSIPAITSNSTNSHLKNKIYSTKKQIRSELLALKKQYKAQKNRKAVAAIQILLVLLAIGLAVFLGILIAFLGCSVSCSGSPTLGIVIWVVGWGGLIWLLIASLKRIIKE